MSEIFSVLLVDTKFFLFVKNIKDFKLEPVIKLSFMWGTRQKNWAWSTILEFAGFKQTYRQAKDIIKNSINVELTSTFLLYRGLVHHHHRILNQKFIVEGNHKDRETDNVKSVRSSLNSHSMWVTMYVNI